MNKIFAFIILLLVITVSVVIITSENANAIHNVPNTPISVSKENNTSILIYPKYSVVEQIINNTNYIYFVNNSRGIQPDLTVGSVPSGDNYSVSINISGNGGDTYPFTQMAAYINGFSDGGTFKFNGYILLDYHIQNIIGLINTHITFAALCGYYAYASFNLSFTNQYYYQNALKSTNNTFTYNPAEITYNSNNTAYVYNSSIPSYESFYDVSYYYSNSTISQPIYANTFAASGNVSFSLNIDNQSFINVHSVLLELPEGIYAYNFTINNKTSTGILYVNNQDTNTILAISLYSNNYVLYLYLGIVFLSLALIGRYTRGFVVSYTLSGLLFVFIGYKEHIEFFTQNLIILIITFLALLFTYKVVMEE